MHTSFPGGGGSGGLIFIDRGNIAAYDYTQADFVISGLWQNKDISAIVPVEAKMVALHVHIRKTTSSERRMHVWNKDHNNIYNPFVCDCIASGIWYHYMPIVPISEGSFGYMITAAASFLLDVAVSGWFL